MSQKGMGQVVVIDGRQIADERSFHSVFAAELGFPAFYGRNMDAWIDCMSDLDRNTGMTSVRVRPGEFVTIRVDHYEDLQRRCPKLAATLNECVAFVNWRRIESGEGSVLALAYDA